MIESTLIGAWVILIGMIIGALVGLYAMFGKMK